MKKVFFISFLLGFFFLIACDKNDPEAKFSATPVTGISPLIVDFTDQSDNEPVSWLWEFGDNTTSNLQNPSHNYKTAGNYTVSLTVTNASGNNTINKSNYIQVDKGIGEPCPGIPTIEYDGQIYNTVLIGNQCWLKENLNIGTMVAGSIDQSDNGIIEKYCYDNNPINCDIYGGLYQWKEAMQYTYEEGEQGICPEGWHIPTFNDWEVLDGFVGDSIWIGDIFQGLDAGYKLKTTNDWNENGNGLDAYGFSALPSGQRHISSEFNRIKIQTFFWSSYQVNYMLSTTVSLRWDQIIAGVGGSTFNFKGLSVRCIKN